MDFSDIEAHGLVLLGCGRMGSALLEGWLAQGLSPGAVHVIEPRPSDWLQAQGVKINGALPANPSAVLIAVKPQMMGDALPALKAIPAGAGAGSAPVFISIAAGTSIAAFEGVLGSDTVIVRAMPNTPAAVGRGISALVGNAWADEAALALAEGLLAAVGQTVRLEHEGQMDAVTALSGSGPAYVFHLIEAMAAAGEAEGLAPDLAMKLAVATVAGAGHLAETSDEAPARLRENVTSPGGTTAAALEYLMDESQGLRPLLRRAVAAAAARARELSQ